MTQQQAEAKAAKLNATRYRKSRIRVRAVRYGTAWVLVGVANTGK